MKAIFSSAAALLAVAVNAQSAPKCSESSKCPESAPCCSQYGQCGVGAYCLGGCDPKSSFSLQSCMAAPVCKSEDYKLTSLAGMEKNTVYLGDASKANWVTSGTAVEYNGDSVLLTMAPSTVGTLISSTHYVWYGKVSVTMTSSQGQGVVTAFILMSDVKDEIDFEFVGDDVSHAQSNYYYQGITDYGNMSPLDATNTRENVHTYTIDWTPDKVTWGIDGKEMRTLEKASTWNSSTGSYHFPQTPSRIQLSLWPAGLETNGEGTIEWAGGLVDWDGPYMQNGYYYAMVNEVNVECYDPPSDWSNTGSGNSAYYYTSTVGTNNTVAIGNNNTILASFMASGNNPNYDPNAKPSGSSSTASAPSMSATPESVPGISGGGNVASSGQAPTESDDGDSSSGSGTGSVSASESSGSSSGSSGFSQGGGSSGSGSGSGDSSAASKTFDGAAVALVGFFVAALML